MDEGELKYWLALWYTPNIGPVTFAEIIENFASLADFFSCPECWSDFRLPAKTMDALAAPDWAEVDRALEWAMQPFHHIITMEDEAYPVLLRDLSDSPPLLFVVGEPEYLSAPQIAMVGARRMTAYGKQLAREFAEGLCRVGLTVTSGLALGVDAESHRGALAVQGSTIAVLGTGIDKIYPAAHLNLAYDIAQNGALVSEFPLGMRATKFTFPRRNRVISGLSLGVLVVEAAQKSGSLITARYASEQGREVFALPGSVLSPLSKGCHELINQGARLVDSVDDILIELKPWLEKQLDGQSDVTQNERTRSIKQPDSSITEEYLALLEFINYDMTPTEMIIAEARLPAGEVSSMLLLLELQGFITSTPGGYMRLKVGSEYE